MNQETLIQLIYHARSISEKEKIALLDRFDDKSISTEIILSELKILWQKEIDFGNEQIQKLNELKNKFESETNDEKVELKKEYDEKMTAYYKGIYEGTKAFIEEAKQLSLEIDKVEGEVSHSQDLNKTDQLKQMLKA